MAAIVLTLMLWLRSPPVPTMSIARSRSSSRQRHQGAGLEHRVEQPGDLLRRLALGPQRDDEPDQLRGGGVAGEDGGHRRPGVRRRQVAPLQQLGEERGPAAQFVDSTHGVRLGGRYERGSDAAALADHPPTFAFGGASPDARLLADLQCVFQTGDAHAALGAHVFASSASSSSSG